MEEETVMPIVMVHMMKVGQIHGKIDTSSKGKQIIITCKLEKVYFNRQIHIVMKYQVYLQS